jgi:hypothetical protein
MRVMERRSTEMEVEFPSIPLFHLTITQIEIYEMKFDSILTLWRLKNEAMNVSYNR